MGKDIACFTRDELAEYFESLGFMEPHTLRDMVAKFASYGDWYVRLEPNTVHHFRVYHVEDFPYAKLFKPLVIETPEKLCTKMEMVYPLDSGQPAMAALCLAWLGIDCGDALKLRNEQVDTKNGQIISPTGEVLVASMPECIRKMLDVYGKTRSAERVQNRTFTVYAMTLASLLSVCCPLIRQKRGSQSPRITSRPPSRNSEASSTAPPAMTRP